MDNTMSPMFGCALGTAILINVSIDEILIEKARYVVHITLFLTDCCGTPSETRTPDPLIKSQLLYQLS